MITKREKALFFIQHNLWPRLFFPKKRDSFKENLFLRKRTDREKNNFSRISPIEPWAFIRVKNEIATLKMSLNNIATIFNKGVIGYNECTDGSKEIIQEFCHNNPSFIAYEYPYRIIPPHSEEYLRKHDYKNTLAAYYNSILDFIPKNEWLVKIDVDHFYFKDVMDYSFHLPETENECVMYPRLNLIRDHLNNWRVIDYINPHDQWLICNKNLYFKNKARRLENGKIFACEYLVLPKHCKYLYKTECASFHFPFEKKSRQYAFPIENLQQFQDFIQNADSNEFSSQALDPDILSQIFS